MTKKLYVLIQDGGDGSYNCHYTFNEEYIKNLEDNEDDMEYGDIGCDGDGFHYDILTVPDESTLHSLGILYDAAED